MFVDFDELLGLVADFHQFAGGKFLFNAQNHALIGFDSDCGGAELRFALTKKYCAPYFDSFDGVLNLVDAALRRESVHSPIVLFLAAKSQLSVFQSAQGERNTRE